MDSTKVFERAETLRQQEKLSVYRLCEKAGISHNTYGLWKSRETLPTVEVLEAISDALGVSLIYLLTGIDDGKITAEEYELLSLWKDLTPERKKVFFQLLKEMQN